MELVIVGLIAIIGLLAAIWHEVRKSTHESVTNHQILIDTLINLFRRY